MSKFIAIVGVSIVLLLSGIAGANHQSPLVNIEKAQKVIIKSGMSRHEKIMIMKCLVMVKKHKTADEAIEAKMAMIKEKCSKRNLSNEKCEKIQKKVAKKIHACYAVHNFFEEFHKTQATK